MGGMLKAVIDTVIGNLQLSITNVHIRWVPGWCWRSCCVLRGRRERAMLARLADGQMSMLALDTPSKLCAGIAGRPSPLPLPPAAPLRGCLHHQPGPLIRLQPRLALLPPNLLTLPFYHLCSYEDAYTNPGHPFACGLTLDALTGYTVDELGKEAFITNNPLAMLRKARVSECARLGKQGGGRCSLATLLLRRARWWSERQGDERQKVGTYSVCSEPARPPIG